MGMVDQRAWEKHVTADLVSRWNGGESAGFIAKTFTQIYGRKFTRNTIISKVHRTPECVRVGASSTAISTRGQRVMALPSKPDRVASQRTPKKIARPPVAFVPAPPPPAEWGPRCVTLDDVGNGCRNVIGNENGRDTLYCGLRTPFRKSYCEHCARVNYQAVARQPARGIKLPSLGFPQRFDLREVIDGVRN